MAGANLAGAKQAAKAFVGQLRLPDDQAAVVAFDANARVAATLGSSGAALGAAIDGLATGAGTRIDRGIAAARAELAGSAHVAGNTPVVVLLTDGRQTEAPGEAEAEAALARGGGTIVYAIGLGADVDRPFLEGLAGAPVRYRGSATPADLAGIYAQVAYDIPCPVERYWGRR